MNEKLRFNMLLAWAQWHCNLDHNDIPDVSLAYEKGFHAACEHLLTLLQQAAPHVYASAQAEHMLDGFKPRRHKIDTLVEQIKAVTELPC